MIHYDRNDLKVPVQARIFYLNTPEDRKVAKLCDFSLNFTSYNCLLQEETRVEYGLEVVYSYFGLTLSKPYKIKESGNNQTILTEKKYSGIAISDFDKNHTSGVTLSYAK